MSRKSATTPRPMPALADGSIPQPGQYVTHADGTRGVIEWSTYGTAAILSGRSTDPPTWGTLVLHDVGNGMTACRVRRTAELHPAVKP